MPTGVGTVGMQPHTAEAFALCPAARQKSYTRRVASALTETLGARCADDASSATEGIKSGQLAPALCSCSGTGSEPRCCCWNERWPCEKRKEGSGAKEGGAAGQSRLKQRALLCQEAM